MFALAFNTRNRKLRQTSAAPRRATVESLESRQMFAAPEFGPVPTTVVPVASYGGFNDLIVEIRNVGGVVPKTPAVKASKGPNNAPLFKTQDLIGEWSGAFRAGQALADSYFSVNFNIRHPGNKNIMKQAFTGTFNLSAMIGNSAALTTVQMSRLNEVKMLIKTDTAVVSFNGALSVNGNYINGRYTMLLNSTGRYTVGAFVMTKNV